MSPIGVVAKNSSSLCARLATAPLATIALLACVAAFSGCSRVGAISDFGLAASSTSTPEKVFSWTDPTIIDAGATFVANNDTSDFCTGTAITSPGFIVPLTVKRGCMQAPPVTYSDSRWFIAFNQSYLDATATNKKFSALINTTDPLTGFFSTVFGVGLGIIDSGLGIIPGTIPASSRYLRTATFPNGDVIAVFLVHNDGVPLDPSDDVRNVYANIYDARSETWGTATPLGEYNAAALRYDGLTDTGADYTGSLTTLCRPTVATSGVGTAMVAWCEQSSSGTYARVLYRIYSGGIWSPLSQLATPATPSYQFAWMTAGVTNFTAAPIAGEQFTLTLTTPAVTYTDTVTAVAGTPAAAQFQIDANACTTLTNLITALKNTATVASDASAAASLADLGVDVKIKSGCVNGTPATYGLLALYTNGSMVPFRDTSRADPKIQILKTTAGTTSTVYPDASANAHWWQSGLVDVAADASGNFTLVRSVVTPFFDQNQPTYYQVARTLVGHEYMATGDWRRNATGTLGAGEVGTDPISLIPQSVDGTTLTVASVRNPKMLLSRDGTGLVLYHQRQNQPQKTGASPYPLRLWFAHYDEALGFSTPAILDTDSFCAIDSVRNDSSVCETGAYDDLDGDGGIFPEAAKDGARFCQVADEPVGIRVSTSHDISPIAAAMNESGTAVIAYHKRYQDPTTPGTCNKEFRTHVVMYDPVNGVTRLGQADDGAGHTMHAQVAITRNGRIAVVWEQYLPNSLTGRGTKAVYLRLGSIAGWEDSPLLIASEPLVFGLANSDSMMPSVGINDSGEIVVTYSSSRTGERRQHVRQYFKH